jgi:hypothetical protein
MRLTFFSLKPVSADVFPVIVATLSTARLGRYSNARRELYSRQRIADHSGRFLAQLANTTCSSVMGFEGLSR